MTTQTFDGYYVFEADQVLTNDHLNQEFYYLDWQERLTRNKLIGTGIVCGLDITSAGGKIGISKGSGVTSQGYLIVLESPVTYDYIAQYTGLTQPADLPFTPDLPSGYLLPFYADYCKANTAYQLLDSTQYTTQNPLPAGSAALTTLTLSNYAVVLFAEINEKDLMNCDTQDCNNKGEKMVITIQALLVPVSALPNPFISAKAKEIKLARYNVPYSPINNSADVLSSFYNILTNGVLDNVAAGYAYCYDRYSGILADTQNPFSTGAVTFDQQLNKALTDLWNNTNRITIQYLYDYINDLILAYYEFRETASSVLLTQCVGHELDFPLHLVLGAATSTTTDMTSDPYRTYFIYSPIFDAQNQGIDRTQFLFNRMKMLAKTLDIQTYTATTDIRITPSQFMDFALSERCIPFYYNPAAVNGTAINQVWNYYKTLYDNDDFILGYNSSTYNSDDSVVSPLLYDIEQYNFFRIEGHIGQQYSDVLSYLLNQQLTYNLPFDIVAISAELLSTANSTAIPECSITDLESEFRLLAAEFLSKLFLCIYKFTVIPYQYANVLASEGTFALAASNAQNINNELFIENFKLEFANYLYGDFYAKYAPFASAGIATIGSAYVQAVQSGGIQNGTFNSPVNWFDGVNLSYMQGYNGLFQMLYAVDNLFYMLLNTDLGDMNPASFSAAYEQYDKLFDSLAVYGGQEVTALFDSCGCECLVTIAERILVLLAEYQTRLNNYLAQVSFLNYYKKHPGLEHKSGVPKGGTFVLVYHEAPAWIYYDQAVPRMAVDTTESGITVTNPNQPTGTKPSQTVTVENSNNLEFTFNQDQVDTIWQLVDQCNDAPANTKNNIISFLPFRPRPGQQQFPQIDNGAIIADFYIPYQCCSDCAPIAYMIDNKLNVYTVSGGGSACANNTNNNTGIAAVQLSGSDLDVNYNLYNSSDPTFKLTMTGTGNPLNFGIQAAAGTYTVTAVSADGNTKVNMNGSAVVTLNTPPTVFNLKTGNNATSYCIGKAGVDIFLDGSQSGVNYQLYNGTTADPAGPVAGNGSLIDFGNKPSGTYTVLATNTTTTCTSNMNGSVTITINPALTAFNVTPAGTTTYTLDQGGVAIGLDGSGAATVNYQLLNNGAIVEGAVVPGTGSTISFGKQAAGTYTVMGTDTTTGCSQPMNGSAVIVEAASVVIKPGSLCVKGQGEAAGSPAGGTYSSSMPNVATVDPNSGFVVAMAPGTTQISYTVNGVTGSQALTVNALPVVFNVTPQGTSDYTTDEQGVVVGLDGSGPATISYQLLNNGVAVAGAVVPGTGKPISFGEQQTGTYTVVATDTTGGCVQTMNGSAIIGGEVTLIMKLNSICANGEDEAVGRPAGGTYTSSAPDIATVNAGGLISAKAAGTVQISYTLNGATASQTLTVNPLPVITVNNPNNPTAPNTIAPGEEISASASVPNGAWATSNSAIVIVKGAGQSAEIAGGQTTGQATITYTTQQGCSGQVVITNMQMLRRPIPIPEPTPEPPIQ